MSKVKYGDISWERMIRAVEKVRARLLRATAALERAGVPYAVAGGNAVAAWVSRVDEAAVRNTRHVDILLRRSDLPAAIAALAEAGFLHRETFGVEMFVEHPEAKSRDAVHVVFAREKVRPSDVAPTPDVEQSERAGAFRVVDLDALVQMKLTSFRDKDRTHLRDMIDVGLIDAAWCQALPPALASRLRELLETPEG